MQASKEDKIISLLEEIRDSLGHKSSKVIAQKNKLKKVNFDIDMSGEVWTIKFPKKESK